MCHRFIILANIVNDLLFGIFTKSTDVIFEEFPTVTFYVVIDVGFIMLTAVGVPSVYVVIAEFSGIDTFILVPDAFTCLRSLQLVRSMSSVKPEQFVMSKVCNFGIPVNTNKFYGSIPYIVYILVSCVQLAKDSPVILGR